MKRTVDFVDGWGETVHLQGVTESTLDVKTT